MAALLPLNAGGIQPTLTTWRAGEGNIETDPTERTDGDTTNWAYHPATRTLARQGATRQDTFAYNTRSAGHRPIRLYL